MSRRMARTAALGAASIALTVAMATPASAGSRQGYCGGGSVIGYVEAAGAGTYDVHGTCGTLGVRGYYTHVGGASWTAWKYSACWGCGSATIYTKNLVQAQHSGSVNRMTFYTYR
jgi:hypothetical protein